MILKKFYDDAIALYLRGIQLFQEFLKESNNSDPSLCKIIQDKINVYQKRVNDINEYAIPKKKRNK